MDLKETENTIKKIDEEDDSEFEVGVLRVGKKEEKDYYPDTVNKKEEPTEAETIKKIEIEKLQEELKILEDEYKKIKERNDASSAKFKILFKSFSLGSAKEEEKYLLDSIEAIKKKIAALEVEESETSNPELNLETERLQKSEVKKPKENKKDLEKILENNFASRSSEKDILKVFHGGPEDHPEKPVTNIEKEMQAMFKDITGKLSEKSILNWQLLKGLRFSEIKDKAGDKLFLAADEVLEEYQDNLGEEAKPKNEETMVKWAERMVKAVMKKKEMEGEMKAA